MVSPELRHVVESIRRMKDVMSILVQESYGNREASAGFRAVPIRPTNLVRRVIHKASRQATLGWRKTLARLVGTQVDRAELAQALRVNEQALSDTVQKIHHALRTRLPVGPADANGIQTVLQQHAPEAIESIAVTADRIADHVFDLLGSGPVALGPTIDWHRDFKSGYRWDPHTFYADIRHGHVPGVDIKVPWELSRGQHLPVLAQAYLLTGRERYAGEVVAQIRDWLMTNPPQFGVNWACAMDVAIRAVNWLWAACLVADSSETDEEFFADLLGGLLAHGRHLMANLEVWADGTTTNHYLANVVGLLYLGLCLPECAESRKWRDFALEAMVQEMDHQVLPDGVDYESSIPYHHLVTEMFLSTALLCRHHAVTLPPAFLARLARMVEFVQAYTKPNGLAPQVGDADDGRLHVLSGYGTADQRDHRHLLALGVLLFEREDWWTLAGPSWHEALWFGGHRAERWSRPPQGQAPSPNSTAFPHAGLYIMRAENDYVLFNCGPVGTGGVGNHKHNDLLSLEVHLGGEDILVDPGSFLYTSDPDARNTFRGTAAHSTVMVDELEQNRFIDRGLFSLHSDARPRVLEWETQDGFDRIVAEHNGYARLAYPVLHRRAVTFERDTRRVEVFDHVVDLAGGCGTHELMWTFVFAHGCLIEPVGNGWIIRTARQRVLLSMPYQDPEGQALSVNTAIEQWWISPRYGVREQALVLRWKWQGGIPLRVRFSMARSLEWRANG